MREENNVLAKVENAPRKEFGIVKQGRHVRVCGKLSWHTKEGVPMSISGFAGSIDLSVDAMAPNTSSVAGYRLQAGTRKYS